MRHSIIQVGAGNWGRSWLKFIDEAAGWDLAALVSRGGENLAKARSEHEIPDDRVFGTLDEALNADGGVVLITAHHALHVPLALKALDAGKHVLIEKPLSDDFDEARKLAEAVADSGRGGWVSQNFRFREGLWRMRSSLAEGTLGKLLHIRLNFRKGGTNKGGPWAQEWRQKQWSFLFNEIIIHHLDMCRFLTGQDAAWISCHGWKPPWCESEGPECASVAVGLADGASMDYCGQTKALCGPQTEFDGDWVLQTDRGCATWGGGDVEWELGDGETGELLGDEGFPGFDRAGVLNDLAVAIEGQTPSALPTVTDNLKSLAMVFAAVRSVKEGRRVELSELIST